VGGEGFGGEEKSVRGKVYLTRVVRTGERGVLEGDFSKKIPLTEVVSKGGKESGQGWKLIWIMGELTLEGRRATHVRGGMYSRRRK